MSDTDKLLPCPFCGSAFIEAAGGQVMCNGCDSGTAVEDDLETAIATWNRRASQAAPAPVAYRLRFAGEGAGDWGIVAPENAGYYIGRDGYECQPLYAAPAPSDGLREENARLREALERVADGHPKDYTDNYLLARAALSTPTEERQ